MPTPVRAIMALAGIALALALASHGASAAEAPSNGIAETAQVSARAEPVEFPQRREMNGLTLLIHAPQIRAWPAFERLEAVMAVEVISGTDGERSYGTATLSGRTELDLTRRIVRVVAPRVDGVTFAATVPEAHHEAVMRAVTRAELDVPLDLFLAHLADDVLATPPPPGFNTEPPPIVVRKKPTLLLFVNGGPVNADVPGTWLKRVVNANWPLYRTTGTDEAYYLLERDRWLTSSKLEKGWKVATALPADFSSLPEEPEHAAARAAVPLTASARPVPDVRFAKVPTELIVTDGEPVLEPIASAGGLEYVTNSESLLFHLDARWYYLVAGRWFASKKLEKGPWTYLAELPDAFSAIPTDHARAAVRASVPGTVESRMAALEALVPTRVSADRNAVPSVAVTYAGEPEFEPIAGTSVARAVNTGFDVVEHAGRYYLLYSGVWYDAPEPTGPWTVAASVPAAIYSIPPSSPSYHVTQVKVAESTPDTVVYTYPQSYSSGVYVAYGVAYYGTGWYYPPYVYGAYYYPYWTSYGYGSWYNPATGGYGSRSVWYGPYGGYSYNQGYNPSTGRYGFVETAWDGDEWASYGETYNPRTGVSTETERYYDDDSDRAEMERTVERGDDWVQTERDIDFDDNTSRTERTTSRGGSSTTTRVLDDGTLTTSGSVTTGDGREYSIAGEATREGGMSTITGSEGSATIETKREDGRSISTIEGSGGGQGVSFSGQGPGRTTIAESGSGDLYAGHDGNVYKKTDGGWQHYEDGGWQQVDTPERPAPTERASVSQYRSEPVQRPELSSDRSRSYDYSQLDRDYRARQQGTRQYQQRAGGMSGMYGGRGGFGRRR